MTQERSSEFARLPGIGPKLAERIETELGIHTWEQLELAAHTGRLQTIAGVGPGRARHVRILVDQKFRNERHSPAVSDAGKPFSEPSVSELLAIDRKYRHDAKVGLLPRVAPKRFNPTGTAWLPVLRSEVGATHFTAFFSNTSAAHAARKTHDWVVILAERDGRTEQYTVVTETRNEWRGERVVRGRERECRQHYCHEAA